MRMALMGAQRYKDRPCIHGLRINHATSDDSVVARVITE